METTELIGTALFAIGILAATAQMAFAYGRDHGARAERLLANRRVSGVLASLDAVKPRPERTRKRLVYRKVNARHVGRKRHLNSRLPGEVVA